MEWLQVGRIVNTHGLKGDVKVIAWTDTPDVFEQLEAVYTAEAGQKLTIQYIKYQKNNLIIKFREIHSIDEAEQYKNKILYVQREALGELPEGVYYIADLIGCAVLDEKSGEKIGVIADVFNTGSNDIYDVKREKGKNILLPAIPEVIRQTDIEKREITVHILDGLEDL